MYLYVYACMHVCLHKHNFYLCSRQTFETLHCIIGRFIALMLHSSPIAPHPVRQLFIMFKGLRPVLEGFSQCTRARAKQEVKSWGRSPRDLTYCSHKPECTGTTNPDRSVLITIITWHFQFHPLNVSNLHVKGAYVLEARAVSRAPPFVTSRGAR